MKYTFASVLIGALACAPVASWAAPAAVSVSKCWIRSLPENLPAGGYFVMTNPTDENVDLVGVRTKAYGKAMLHQTLSKNGVSTMVMVKKVVVPAHGTASFSPGHYHVMLEQAAKPLKPGMTVAMTLLFDNGQHASVECKVKGPGAMSW